MRSGAGRGTACRVPTVDQRLDALTDFDRNASCGLYGILRVMPTKKTKQKRKVLPKKSGASKPVRASKSVAANKKSAAGTNPRRVAAILAKLDEAYPAATCELKHENAFQLLISTILSAQCTDVRVNQVTETLYKKYSGPEAFAYANPRELEQEIRPTGFFRNKTKSIMGASKAVVETFGGQVPKTMDEILTLPGVARKTGNVVLGTAYGIASGVVVDTHVIRLSRRLDLTKHEDPKKIEQDLMRVIPKEKWIQFSHLLVWHGRRACVACQPRRVECNLESICYSKDKTLYLTSGGPQPSAEFGEGFALLGETLQQWRGLPPIAEAPLKFADALVDLFQADGVGVPHRSTGIRGKAVAIEIDDVDVHGAKRDAFFEEARALVNQRVDAAIDDFLCENVALWDAGFGCPQAN